MTAGTLFRREGRYLGWLALAGLAAVVGYNIWAYCCGRCAAAHFLQLNGVTWLLMAGNLVALTILVMLKLRHRWAETERICVCGQPDEAEWIYCPNCGRKR